MSRAPSQWLTISAEDTFSQISTTSKKVKTKECKPIGTYPVIDQGQEYIAGYIEDHDKVISVSEPIVIFGDHTRTIKWVDKDFVPGADGTKLLSAHEFLNRRFFYHQLKSIELPDKGYARHFKLLKEAEFAIPPLAEQQQIARQLDSLLAQVDSLKARLEALPALLKRFRQSVLAAAVSGKLTEQWRSNTTHSEEPEGKQVIQRDLQAKNALSEQFPELKKKKSSLQSDIDTNYLFDLPESWEFSTWGKISEWITYGFTKPMPKAHEGIKLLTAKDVKNFSIEISDAGLTTTAAFESLSDKDRPAYGDLLITKDGSIGRAALVKANEPFCINQSVAVCWLRSTSMNKYFLEILANSEFTQKFVQDKAQGMAIQHLSIIDFAKCPVPVPPLAEQTEIVRRVEELFAFAEQIENQVKAAKSHVDKLTQSILAKAFRGELTADWRAQNPELINGENSAAALLERIRAERACMKPAKRGRARSV